MQIKIVTGPSTYFAGKNLISKIDAKSPLRHFCLVPDRFSLQAETLVMDTLGISSTFNIEVLGLSRLAYRVLKELGFVGSPLTSDENLLLTDQSIENVKDNFKSFKKTSISFAQEVSKVIAQFKSCCLAPEDIAPKKCRQSIKDKYHDLALIYQEYQNLIGSRIDASKLITLFSSMIEDSQILKDVNLYLLGFDSFTAEMFGLLRTLAKATNCVYIALATPLGQANGYIYESDILKKLTTLCHENGITITIEEPPTTLVGAQKDILLELFSGKPAASAQKGYFLPLSCLSAQQEVESAGKLINMAIRQGARYKDFVIACGDLEKYLPFLQRTLADLDIPYFADHSVTADKLVLSQTIFKFLRVVSSGYSKETLADFFAATLNKCGSTDQILQTISKHSICGKAKAFKYLSPLAREQLQMFDDLSKAETNEQFCQQILRYCQSVEENYLQLLQDLGQDYATQADLNAQAERYLFDALHAIQTYRAQQSTSASGFAKTLTLLLSFNEVATVPTYVDSVMIGDATSSYFSQCKNLILLGCQHLPRVLQDNGLVSDNDIENLDLVRSLEPSIRVLTRRNRFKLFNLLSLAQDSLIATFCSFNDDGKKIEMPNFVDNLCQIFEVKPVRAKYLFSSFEDDEKFLAGLGSRKLALMTLAAKPCQDLTSRQFSSLQQALKFDLSSLDIDRERLSADGEKLFFANGKTSVSQIECYFSCPFKHFLRYGLRLTEEDNFGPKEIGNVCHKMAENFVREFADSLAAMTPRDNEKYVTANLAKVIEQVGIVEILDSLDERDFALSYLARQCCQILDKICYEQKYSKFKPLYLEKRLEGARLSIGKTGKSLALSGKVDRIDVYDQYFRVVDYKTGKVSPLVKDLYYGDKLQLFIYQKGLENMLGLSSCGIFYFDCKFDFAEEGSTLLKGLMVNDDQLIAASDTRLGTQEKSDILAVSTRKNKDSFKGGAICKSSIGALENYAQAVAQNALEEIAGGYITPKPDEEACQFCAYKGICLFAGAQAARKKDRIDENDILDALKGGDDE